MMYKIDYTIGSLVLYKEKDESLSLVKIVKIKYLEDYKVLYGVRYFRNGCGTITKTENIFYVEEESLCSINEVKK